jgi:UDP-N-acetylmuramyl pentapeptide phosphotransferase/UDP-N-acetylglucosamine-1-phosphate transferase
LHGIANIIAFNKTGAATMGQLLFVLVLAALMAALISVALIMLLRPWLRRYALARPNARSSHKEPTPQGGGIAVVAATLVVAWIVPVLLPTLVAGQFMQLLAVTAAAVLLALVGGMDDVRTLAATPRLIAQFATVGLVIAMLPVDSHVFAPLPSWFERICLVLAGVWFVNLVNFMDGIDWMTVAETVPITAAVVLFGLVGAVAPLPSFAAVGLLGATLGFAPFNKPVAKLFLGDVGSLPIGLLLGWLLLEVAASGHLAAAALLPLYYLADSTLTLCRRLVANEPFWQAHRAHFYQRAVDHGLTVREIVSRVFLVNLALAALALVTVAKPSLPLDLAALAAGTLVVGWLLMNLSRGRSLAARPQG